MVKSCYIQEFKNEAVKLSLKKDANRQEIAHNFGIKYKNLCNWIT